jgi:hypothetical protein
MTVRGNAAPQCPYCPTLMLFVRPLHRYRTSTARFSAYQTIMKYSRAEPSLLLSFRVLSATFLRRF